MAPKDSDISTMTQLIDILQDRGCSVDKATARQHSDTLAKLDVKLEMIIQGQGEILKRMDSDRQERDTLKEDVADLKRILSFIKTSAVVIFSILTLFIGALYFSSEAIFVHALQSVHVQFDQTKGK